LGTGGGALASVQSGAVGACSGVLALGGPEPSLDVWRAPTTGGGEVRRGHQLQELEGITGRQRRRVVPGDGAGERAEGGRHRQGHWGHRKTTARGGIGGRRRAGYPRDGASIGGIRRTAALGRWPATGRTRVGIGVLDRVLWAEGHDGVGGAISCGPFFFRNGPSAHRVLIGPSGCRSLVYNRF
jgi:hypothetical protein